MKFKQWFEKQFGKRVVFRLDEKDELLRIELRMEELMLKKRLAEEWDLKYQAAQYAWNVDKHL